MLRVHRFDEPYSLRLRIEGVLVAEAVSDLEQLWNDLLSKAEGRKLSVDASGITRADDVAIAFLRRVQSMGSKVDDDGRFVTPAVHGGALVRIRHAACATLCAIIPSFHGCPCDQRA